MGARSDYTDRQFDSRRRNYMGFEKSKTHITNATVGYDVHDKRFVAVFRGNVIGRYANLEYLVGAGFTPWDTADVIRLDTDGQECVARYKPETLSFSNPYVEQ